jgi:hypothetical protein
LNWVDLEDKYFDLLVKYSNRNTKSFSIEKIKLINEKFEILKHLLQKYLIIQQSYFKTPFDKFPLVDCFCDKIYKH